MTKHSAKANAQTTEGLESALSSLDISSNAADQDGVNVNKGQAAQSATYFDRFPEFKVNNAAPIRDEFRRLAKEQGWGKKSANFKTQHLMCMTMEFDRYHGQLTSTNLQAWQQLCIEIARDQPVPGSITKCKKVGAAAFDLYEVNANFYHSYCPRSMSISTTTLTAKELASQSSLSSRTFTNSVTIQCRKKSFL